VPLVSWVAPANRNEVELLLPSVRYCARQLDWLGDMFLNSLRFGWSMCLLADAVQLLRAQALLLRPETPLPLYELTPRQMAFDLP